MCRGLRIPRAARRVSSELQAQYEAQSEAPLKSKSQSGIDLITTWCCVMSHQADRERPCCTGTIPFSDRPRFLPFAVQRFLGFTPRVCPTMRCIRPVAIAVRSGRRWDCAGDSSALSRRSLPSC